MTISKIAGNASPSRKGVNSTGYPYKHQMTGCLTITLYLTPDGFVVQQTQASYMQYEQRFRFLFNRNIHIWKLNSFQLCSDLHPHKSLVSGYLIPWKLKSLFFFLDLHSHNSFGK
jgi:hypothetical protein